MAEALPAFTSVSHFLQKKKRINVAPWFRSEKNFQRAGAAKFAARRAASAAIVPSCDGLYRESRRPPGSCIPGIVANGSETRLAWKVFLDFSPASVVRRLLVRLPSFSRYKNFSG
jgi:hypothetical protein